MVDVGAALPQVTAKDNTWADVDLQKLPRPLALSFYPKADTPGCTNESGQFDLRDPGAHAEIAGVEMLVGDDRDRPVRFAEDRIYRNVSLYD